GYDGPCRIFRHVSDADFGAYGRQRCPELAVGTAVDMTGLNDCVGLGELEFEIDACVAARDGRPPHTQHATLCEPALLENLALNLRALAGRPNRRDHRDERTGKKGDC